MKKILIISIFVIAALLTSCAKEEQAQVVQTQIITLKPTTTPESINSNDEMLNLTLDIINQVINKEISEDTINALRNLGIDDNTLNIFEEAVKSDEEVSLYNDGIFIGTAEAHNGDITVEVTIHNGKIIYIYVLDHSENAPAIEDVLKSIPVWVIKEQAAEDIDTISGATEASNGYIAAISNALDQAKR